MYYQAVASVIEFVYQGEVVIGAQQLTTVAQAAHSLGIHGLQEFLPYFGPVLQTPQISVEPKQHRDQGRGKDRRSSLEHSREDENSKKQYETSSPGYWCPRIGEFIYDV